MTLRAAFTASNFPAGSSVPATGRLSFTAPQLMHALFTTGRASGHEWAHSSLSLFEWLHRASIVPAYLARAAGGGVCRTPLADSLDRSEKVNLSYAIGQAGTALFARQQLAVRRLMHLDRYGRTHGIVLTSRRSPDLFGLGSGGWVIAESKGRSNNANMAFARTAKTQATLVSSVGGLAPWCRAGVVTYFDKPGRRMVVLAVDPAADDEARDLPPIPKDRFDYAYYAAFVSAIGADPGEETVADASYRVRVLDGTGLTIGLRSDLYEQVRAGVDLRTVAVDDESMPLFDSRRPEVQTDGSLFRADWDLQDVDTAEAMERMQ